MGPWEASCGAAAMEGGAVRVVIVAAIFCDEEGQASRRRMAEQTDFEEWE